MILQWLQNDARMHGVECFRACYLNPVLVSTVFVSFSTKTFTFFVNFKVLFGESPGFSPRWGPLSLSPMKMTETQPDRSAIYQSRLRWDFQKQGNPPAIELIAGRMRSQWNLCDPGTIDRSTCNPLKTERFRCYPQSNLT